MKNQYYGSVCACVFMCEGAPLHSECWWSAQSWSGWSPLPAHSHGDNRWTGLGETPTAEGIINGNRSKTRAKKNENKHMWCGWQDKKLQVCFPFTHRLHKIKHLPLLDLLHLEDVLQGNFVEMLPHIINLTVRLSHRRQIVKTEGLMLIINAEKYHEQHLTSWRWASFFLADRLRCFSNTAQYFSVSLSYFFLASFLR